MFAPEVRTKFPHNDTDLSTIGIASVSSPLNGDYETPLQQTFSSQTRSRSFGRSPCLLGQPHRDGSVAAWSLFPVARQEVTLPRESGVSTAGA